MWTLWSCGLGVAGATLVMHVACDSWVQVRLGSKRSFGFRFEFDIHFREIHIFPIVYFSAEV